MKSLSVPRWLIVLVALVCICVVIYSFYLIVTRPFDVRILDVRFQVGDSIGLEIDKEALTFGRVLPGTSATRSIVLDNPYSFPVATEVFVDKALSNYITTDQPKFTIEPSSSLNVSFTLVVPPSFPSGNYSGTLRFEFRR